jgi:hypothetical protein
MRDEALLSIRDETLLFNYINKIELSSIYSEFYEIFEAFETF